MLGHYAVLPLRSSNCPGRSHTGWHSSLTLSCPFTASRVLHLPGFLRGSLRPCRWYLVFSSLLQLLLLLNSPTQKSRSDLAPESLHSSEGILNYASSENDLDLSLMSCVHRWGSGNHRLGLPLTQAAGLAQGTSPPYLPVSLSIKWGTCPPALHRAADGQMRQCACELQRAVRIDCCCGSS